MGDTCEFDVKRGRSKGSQTWQLDAKIKAKMPEDQWEALKNELCRLFKKYRLDPPPNLNCPKD
jgi:hypothetical protein